jgi:hypothetical protein
MSPGWRRYQTWQGREALRQDTLHQQREALSQAHHASAPRSPPPSYPPPRRNDGEKANDTPHPERPLRAVALRQVR